MRDIDLWWWYYDTRVSDDDVVDGWWLSAMIGLTYTSPYQQLLHITSSISILITSFHLPPISSLTIPIFLSSLFYIYISFLFPQPLEIYINDGSKLTLHGLKQYFVNLTEAEKNRKLVDLLDALEFNQVVVFVKSVNRANELNKLLVDCNFPSICIHGGMKQDERYEISFNPSIYQSINRFR